MSASQVSARHVGVRQMALTLALLGGVLADAGAQIAVPKTAPPKTRAGGSITTKAPTGQAPRKPNGQPDLTGRSEEHTSELQSH